MVVVNTIRNEPVMPATVATKGTGILKLESEWEWVGVWVIDGEGPASDIYSVHQNAKSRQRLSQQKPGSDSKPIFVPFMTGKNKTKYMRFQRGLDSANFSSPVR